MRKVALVTCYFKHNYGSMLQAYATQKALDELGIENETINISGFNGEIKRAKLRYFAQATLTSDILISKIGMVQNRLRKKIHKQTYGKQSQIREARFREFVTQHIRISKVYESKNQLAGECRKRYSTVLVGSDQLWLPVNIAADYYTLNFVPDEVNKVAYATSFGMSTLPKSSKEKAKQFLQRMNHIGVREESGQMLIREIIERDVPVVCDPTLLFTSEEWEDIEQEAPIEKKPYILCYLLGTNNLHREFALKLKAETGMILIALVHLDEFVKIDDTYADKTPYDVGPAEFLNYVRHASYICTDSYHCSIFASLYHKEFFTFRRYIRDTKQSTNNRVEYLLGELGVTERLLIGNEDVRTCMTIMSDYQAVDSNIERIRSNSYEYLRKALGR